MNKQILSFRPSGRLFLFLVFLWGESLLCHGADEFHAVLEADAQEVALFFGELLAVVEGEAGARGEVVHDGVEAALDVALVPLRELRVVRGGRRLRGRRGGGVSIFPHDY